MNETAKQVLHFNVLKGFSSGQSDEHQRGGLRLLGSTPSAKATTIAVVSA